MLSESLKERLAQYKTLKEEEKRTVLPSAPPLPVMECAPQSSTLVDTLPQDPPSGAAIPAKLSVPTGNNKTSLDVSTSPGIGLAEEAKEFLIGTNKQKEDIEEISPNTDGNFFSESEDDDEPHRNEIKEGEGHNDQDQDVFKALDEAEMVENECSSRKEGASDGGHDSLPQNNVRKKLNIGSKKKCIMYGVIFLACAAIVAIVLPFYLDYPPGRGVDFVGNKSGDDSGSTSSPTAVPTMQEWAQLLKTFLIPISGKEIFEDENSPQYQAAKFFLDDPYTTLISTTERLHDRYACVTFYFATEGENWRSCYLGDENCDSGQWLVDDVCDWHAVSCDDNGRVTSLIFANAEGNNLVGTLPFEMKLLSGMTDLVIVNNTIKGTLPITFGEEAESLRSLLLPYNELTGSIPQNYLRNSPLEFVHLGNNDFSGPIPTNIGNATYLQQLDLSENLMTGTIPEEIREYKVLEALSLANNTLQGTIPGALYEMTRLKLLHLNGNALTGTMSSFIGGLSSLMELHVGRSELSGYIPDELYSLTNLVELDIGQALFTGRLSLGFLNLEDLEKLIISDNELSGTIPFEFGQLVRLSDFNLEGNEFFGAIPESVCLLRETNLEVLTANCDRITCDCCSDCL